MTDEEIALKKITFQLPKEKNPSRQLPLQDKSNFVPNSFISELNTFISISVSLICFDKKKKKIT